MKKLAQERLDTALAAEGQIKTVNDLRRAIEGVPDDTPLALEFLDGEQHTRAPVGEMGLYLSTQGGGMTFVLETDDMVTFEEMRADLHRRVAEAEAAPPPPPVLYGQLLDDFRYLAEHEPPLPQPPEFALVEERFKRSMRTLLGTP